VAINAQAGKGVILLLTCTAQFMVVLDGLSASAAGRNIEATPQRGRAASTSRSLYDFVHVLEYLWKAA